MDRYMTSAEKSALVGEVHRLAGQRYPTVNAASFPNTEPDSGRSQGTLAAPGCTPRGRAYFWRRNHFSKHHEYNVVEAATDRIVARYRLAKNAARHCHDLNKGGAK